MPRSIRIKFIAQILDTWYSSGQSKKLERALVNIQKSWMWRPLSNVSIFVQKCSLSQNIHLFWHCEKPFQLNERFEDYDTKTKMNQCFSVSTTCSSLLKTLTQHQMSYYHQLSFSSKPLQLSLILALSKKCWNFTIKWPQKFRNVFDPQRSLRSLTSVSFRFLD